MRPLVLSEEQRAYIQERIDRFAEEAPRVLLWQLPYVQSNHALPLYLGWTETVGIRPSGELIRWQTEDYSEPFELDGARWKKIALVLGAEKYPPLRNLIPVRPEHASDCDMCKGSGRFPLQPKILCGCGGVGWLDPAED